MTKQNKPLKKTPPFLSSNLGPLFILGYLFLQLAACQPTEKKHDEPVNKPIVKRIIVKDPCNKCMDTLIYHGVEIIMEGLGSDSLTSVEVYLDTLHHSYSDVTDPVLDSMSINADTIFGRLAFRSDVGCNDNASHKIDSIIATASGLDPEGYDLTGNKGARRPCN